MLTFADNMHLPFLMLNLVLKNLIMTLFGIFLVILSTDEHVGLAHG